MMNWIEGQWPDRFKCIVQHDGVFDARAMAYETEELWFDEWEHGGQAYYEDAGRVREMEPGQLRARTGRRRSWSITSEKDFRIPYTQGHRRLHRAPAPQHPVAAAGLPGREPLGAEAEELDPMVRRGVRLDGAMAGTGAAPGAAARRRLSEVDAAAPHR